MQSMPTFAAHGSHYVGVGWFFFQVHPESLSGREKKYVPAMSDGAVNTDRAALSLVGPCGQAI